MPISLNHVSHLTTFLRFYNPIDSINDKKTQSGIIRNHFEFFVFRVLKTLP